MSHIYKEKSVRFNIGYRVMSHDDRPTRGDRFCEVGCRALGGKKLEDLVRIADALEQRWPT